MQRVMICGGPGSGKSWLAREIGARLNRPAVHLDAEHFLPGWEMRDKPTVNANLRRLYQTNFWVIDGNWSETFPDRLARADTLIWLDVPIAVRLVRITRRMLRSFGQTRPDLAPGCTETLRGNFELMRYAVRTRRRSAAKYGALYRDPPAHLHIVRLTGTAEVARFLEQEIPA